MTGNFLHHVAIRVKDMDRAVSYYMSLGFNCEWESDDWSYFEEGIALLGPGYDRADPHVAFYLDTHVVDLIGIEMVRFLSIPEIQKVTS